MPPKRIGVLVVVAILLAGCCVVYRLLAQATSSGESDLSSLDTSPTGAGALFGSYARAGLTVVRGWDDDSIQTQPPAATTAFVVDPGDWSDTFDANLDAFVKAGGRLILLRASIPASPVPDTDDRPKTKNKDQKPKGKTRGKPPHPESALERDADATLGAMPIEKPKDAQWAVPVDGALPAGVRPLPLLAPRQDLQIGRNWQVLYANGAAPIMAQTMLGSGTLVMASESGFISNDNLSQNPDPVLLSWLTGGRSQIWVDESQHGLDRVRGTLWLMQRWRLNLAVWLIPALILLVAWWLSAGLERPPIRGVEEEMRTQLAGTGFVRLLERVTSPAELAERCRQQFALAYPSDAFVTTVPAVSPPKADDKAGAACVEEYNRIRTELEKRRRT